MDETAAISATVYRRLAERLRDLGSTRCLNLRARTRLLGVANGCDSTAQQLERQAAQPTMTQRHEIPSYTYDPYA
ncbi:hypothetical protein D3C84_1254160 [compost metagenome]